MTNTPDMISTETLWSRYKDPLQRFIRQKVKNENDAEDILQEAFIKVHLKKETLKDNTKIQPWLYQVTRNLINDFYRRPKTVLKAELDHAVTSDENETMASPADCIPQFLNRLPGKYREALESAELKGIPQNQLAEKLHISYSGLKSRVQRAKLMMHEFYRKCCGSVGLNEQSNDPCDKAMACGCHS